jgi:hypothetical protein
MGGYDRMPKDPEQQVLFAFVPADKSADGVPLIAFLMPEPSWGYMAEGLAHEFDLTNVGLPLRIVIGRTPTREAGLDLLRAANGGPLTDINFVLDVDLSFDQARK